MPSCNTISTDLGSSRWTSASNIYSSFLESPARRCARTVSVGREYYGLVSWLAEALGLAGFQCLELAQALHDEGHAFLVNLLKLLGPEGGLDDFQQPYQNPVGAVVSKSQCLSHK